MKKLLVLLLAVMILSFTACGDAQTEGDATTTSTQAVTTTESQGGADATTTTTTTIVTTTDRPLSTTIVPATTTQPAKLNPKTSFKFGKYTTAVFENNKQIYRKVSLYFYEEFNTVEVSYTEFYTIEQCKKQYESWGSSFDENEFSYESKLTVGGVTYYDIGVWGNVPISYELTDTLIKTSPDEGYAGEFSLNPNGTLTLEKQDDTFGQKGTVYTFTAE